ncbi:MAG: ZIP family metal transporter, partial [Chloroflexi bacterium]
MIDYFEGLHPVLQALIATGFTWGLTALGAAAVFLTRSFNRRLLDSMLGFAAGVMIAASFWSLLAPSIEMAEEHSSLPAWTPAVIGFLLGGVFLRSIDMVMPHLHLNAPREAAEGIP